jgi:formate dehydrogenase major subunit
VVRRGSGRVTDGHTQHVLARIKVPVTKPPGVVYTTFHHPETGANVVTTEYSDWATSCPEYKVTAVEVRQTNRWSNWQAEHDDFIKRTTRIAAAE